MAKLWYWAPRILGILAILFISVFALDAFQAGVPPLQILADLFMHLIPSAVLAVLLAAAWRYEFAGGLLFIIISFIPFFFLRNVLWANVLLCAPFLCTGILFTISSYRASR